MNHSDLAVENFKKGYNCSQSVVVAFCDVTGMTADYAARLSSSFGGGMGRMREVCGAVSGMLMVAGLLFGYDWVVIGGAKPFYKVFFGITDNLKVPTSYMAVNSKYDFEGGYENNTKGGMLHVANHHLSPGKKKWTSTISE